MANQTSKISEPHYSLQKDEMTPLLGKRRLEKGDTWYLLDVRWFKQWKRYVGFESWDQKEMGSETAHPGPVDTSCLFKDRRREIIKDHLMEDLDYSLVPEEVWKIFVSWYGIEESSRPIPRRVVEHGLYVKHCKVEVYLVEFKLALHPDVDTTKAKKFSRADTVGHVMNATKQLYDIPEEKECRLWHKYMLSTYDLLSKLDETIQDAGLPTNQVLTLEQKNYDGTWPRETTTYVHQGTNMTSVRSSDPPRTSSHSTSSAYTRTSSKDKQDPDKPSYSTVTSKEGLKTATTTAATITKPVVATAAHGITKHNRHQRKQMKQAQVIQRALPPPVTQILAENLNQSSTQVSTASTSKSSTKSVNLVELSISAKPVVSDIKVLQSGNTNDSEKVSEAESKLIDQLTEMIKKAERESMQKITTILENLDRIETNLSKNIASLTERLNHKETEIVAQEKRLSTMAQLRDKEYAEVNQEMAKLRQKLQQNEREANQEIKTLNERLRQSKRENSTVVEGLQERLQLKENRLTALNQKIDNLQERLQEKEAGTNQRVAELTSRLEQTKREASQEYTSLSERLQLKEEELTTVNQEFTAFQERTQEVEMQQHERIQMQETQLQAFCNNALQQMRQQIEAQMQQQIQQITNQLTMMQKLFNAVKPQWLISRHEIALTQNELGNGGWGRVVKATFRSKQVAAKCLHHQIISDYNVQQFVREMQISSKCHHPNLLKFLGATLEGDPIILTELMDTNLYDVIRRHELRDHQVVLLLQDIASAINYLHSLSPEPIIHRDISSSNVLLNGPVRSKWVVKLSDFGSANFLWHTSEQSRAPGNPTYAAPEVLSPHSHSEKMDVYSFGVLLFEICSSQAPSLQLRKEVLPSAAAVWPEPYRHFVPLIVSCTRDNKDERPTMSDVLAEL